MPGDFGGKEDLAGIMNDRIICEDHEVLRGGIPAAE